MGPQWVLEHHVNIDYQTPKPKSYPLKTHSRAEVLDERGGQEEGGEDGTSKKPERHTFKISECRTKDDPGFLHVCARRSEVLRLCVMKKQTSNSVSCAREHRALS